MSLSTTYPTYAKTVALATSIVASYFARQESLAEISHQRAEITSQLGPLPGFSRMAISIRGALFGLDDPMVVRMCERNQMLREIEKHGFALPEVAA